MLFVLFQAHELNQCARVDLGHELFLVEKEHVFLPFLGFQEFRKTQKLLLIHSPDVLKPGQVDLTYLKGFFVRSRHEVSEIPQYAFVLCVPHSRVFLDLAL
ncbi:hypothetical protein ES703_83591 [subsurface metagenome]